MQINRVQAEIEGSNHVRYNSSRCRSHRTHDGKWENEIKYHYLSFYQATFAALINVLRNLGQWSRAILKPAQIKLSLHKHNQYRTGWQEVTQHYGVKRCKSHNTHHEGKLSIHIEHDSATQKEQVCVCVWEREREREKENYGKRNDQLEDCYYVVILPGYICYAKMLRSPRQWSKVNANNEAEESKPPHALMQINKEQAEIEGSNHIQ